MRIVGGRWGGRRITAPAGRDTRPTTDRVREAWMSAVAAEVNDAAVVDLFAGSGALGLEALSRGARHVTFVESAPAALKILERNLADLGADPDMVEVVRADALRFCESLPRLAYDLAFADPPYGRSLAPGLAALYNRSPFARILCVEHSRDESVGGESVVWERRYGDTCLTFLRAVDER